MSKVSQIVSANAAKQYYDKALHRLHQAGTDHFGIRIEGTADYPSRLQDTDYPLSLFYYQGLWDLAYTPGVAVVGTPLWMSYPKENAALQKEMIKNHLLISRVPIVTYEEKGINFTHLFFPERNITMAALSQATIIVEASETSGMLKQARTAIKQGRKVFILNNNFENSQLTWPKKLEAMGAVRVHAIEDILQRLNNVANQTSENRCVHFKRIFQS